MSHLLEHKARVDTCPVLCSAADLHLSILRMIDLLPVDHPFAEKKLAVESILRGIVSEEAAIGLAEHVEGGPQLVGEREDAAHAEEPVDLSTIRSVQILVGGHVLVAGQNAFAELAESIVDGDITLGICRCILLGAGTAQDHTARVMVALCSGDIRITQNEIAHIPAFDKCERVAVGAILHIAWLPVPCPVPVGIVEAGTILVDAAIAIVIEPLGAEQLELAWLSRLGADHQTGIARIGLPSPVRIAASHFGDVAIAI